MEKKLRVCFYLIFLFFFAFPVVGKAEVIQKDISAGDVTITNAGDYEIIGESNQYTITVNVSSNDPVNITINGLDIDVSAKEKVCAFDIKAGTVNLTLEGNNNLKSGYYCAGLNVSNDSKLIINGEGELNVTSQGGAGIGGNRNSDVGNITIDGGNINAIGTFFGAGIGGDEYKNGGNITITGGSVKAKGGDSGGAGIGGGRDAAGGTIKITGGAVNAEGGAYGAGIGGGDGKNGGTIIIEGGVVRATGGEGKGSGIGGGYDGDGGDITITGGSVTAIGGIFRNEKGAGIGKGYNGNPGTFSSAGGNAFIIASSISDNGSDKKNNWQGVIFEGDNGAVYGNPTIKTDAEIPVGKILTIDDGKTLSLAKGVILTNNGTINGKDKIKCTVTYHRNYDAETSTEVDNEYDSAPSYTGFTRQYYTIEGWYDKASGGNNVTNIIGSIDLYAKWKKNEIKIKSSTSDINGTYGEEINYELSDLLDADSYKDNIEYKSSDLGNYGLSISGNKITGTPNKVTNGTASLTITISSTDCDASKDANINIKISKADVSIEDFSGVSDFTYNGSAVNITAPEVKDGNGVKIADATLSYSFKNSSQTYEPTTAANSGAAGDGEAPKYAGEYKVTAGFAENANYNAASEKLAPFTIEQAALTVTPLSSQEVFKKDVSSFVPKYKVEGAAGGDNNLFTGQLALNDDIIVIGSLELKEAFKRNYSLAFTDNVAVTIKDDPVDPVPPDPDEPDDPVIPDPVYYTVSLPAITGATTDPAAGDYKVESWSSFRFYLTLDEAYNQSKPVVTTDRGETISPRASDGAYILKYVCSDIAVTIDGIVKNPDPVANEIVNTNRSRVWSAAGYLHILPATTGKVYLFTIDGRLQKIEQAAAGQELSVALPTGSYIVGIAGERFKVIL